jgi:hypothetical protein
LRLVIPRVIPALLLVLGASCALVPPRHGTTGRTAALEPHPWAVVHGDLRVEARYYIDQTRIFGGDLAGDYGLVPVALRLGRVDAGGGVVVAVPDDMQLALHLADGTALRRVGPTDVRLRQRRLERLVLEGFEGGVIPAWEQASEGFVYFALPPGVTAEAGGLHCVHRVAGGSRSLDLGASLLSLEVVIEGRPRTLAVGLGIDRRGGRGE